MRPGWRWIFTEDKALARMPYEQSALCKLAESSPVYSLELQWGHRKMYNKPETGACFPTRNSKGGSCQGQSTRGETGWKVGNWAEHTSTQRCVKIQLQGAKQVPQRTAIKLDSLWETLKSRLSKPRRLQQWEMKGCVEGWGWGYAPEELLPLTCPGKEIEGGCL